MDYSILFCVQPDFEVYEAHRLLRSIILNTSCEDVHVFTNDEEFFRREFRRYPHLTLHEGEALNPNHPQSFKIPALKYGRHSTKVFVDTSAILLGEIQSYITAVDRGVLLNPVDLNKDFDRPDNWSRWGRALGIRSLPDSLPRLVDSGETPMRTSSVIVVRGQENFAQRWKEVYRELEKRFEEFDGHACDNLILQNLDQISLTLTVAKMELQCLPFPPSVASSYIHLKQLGEAPLKSAFYKFNRYRYPELQQKLVIYD